MEFDAYACLGVTRNATDVEIRQAYKRLALRWHPDKNQDNKETAEEMFKQVSQAYELLSNPDARQSHDQEEERRRSSNMPHYHTAPQRPTPFTDDERRRSQQPRPAFTSSRFSFHDPFQLFDQLFFGTNADFFGDDAFSGDPFLNFMRQRRGARRMLAEGGDFFGSFFEQRPMSHFALAVPQFIRFPQQEEQIRPSQRVRSTSTRIQERYTSDGRKIRVTTTRVVLPDGTIREDVDEKIIQADGSSSVPQPALRNVEPPQVSRHDDYRHRSVEQPLRAVERTDVTMSSPPATNTNSTHLSEPKSNTITTVPRGAQQKTPPPEDHPAQRKREVANRHVQNSNRGTVKKSEQQANKQQQTMKRVENNSRGNARKKSGGLVQRLRRACGCCFGRTGEDDDEG